MMLLRRIASVNRRAPLAFRSPSGRHVAGLDLDGGGAHALGELPLRVGRDGLIVGAYVASFMYIGVVWVNHHAERLPAPEYPPASLRRSFPS